MNLTSFIKVDGTVVSIDSDFIYTQKSIKKTNSKKVLISHQVANIETSINRQAFLYEANQRSEAVKENRIVKKAKKRAFFDKHKQK